jgi:hypothetical protein
VRVIAVASSVDNGAQNEVTRQTIQEGAMAVHKTEVVREVCRRKSDKSRGDQHSCSRSHLPIAAAAALRRRAPFLLGARIARGFNGMK